MDSFLGELADLHLEIFVVGNFAIVALVMKWIEHRQETAARIAANEAGGLCPHGRYFWNRSKCEGCKADLAKEFSTAEKLKLSTVDQVTRVVLKDGTGNVLVDAAAPAIAAGARAYAEIHNAPPSGSFDLAYKLTDPAPRPQKPLRIELPWAHRGHVELVLDTNAKWPGAAAKFAIEQVIDPASGAVRVLTFREQIPASVRSYHVGLSRSFGHHLKTLLLQDHEGIDRVRVLVDGTELVNAEPAVLIALGR